MRRSRRRWLRVLLLVTQAAALGSSAVTLRRDSSDALDSSWGGRDDCQKCPAGSYLAEECKEQHGSGRCEPCGEGEFMEYPNTFQSCQECSKCREDQVQLSPCQPSRNTVCACRDGTFCPPEHPCEMCQKCQPRCPEGQEVLKPCTADSDLQCAPARGGGTVSKWAIGVITAVVVVVLVMVLFCIWKRLCRAPGDGRSSSKGPCKMMSSMFRKLKYKSVEAGDNATNEQRDPGSEPPVTPPSGSVRPKEPPSARPEWNLVPAPGDTPIQRLRDSFYTFAKKVYTEHWKKFGRHLKLEENDVAMARTEDGVYEMLLRWQSREGTKASVNTLLEILEELNLGGVAEEISCVLIQKGLFQAGAEGGGEQAAPPSFQPEPSNTSQDT
ncbi:tumor necrosis factor receptor superfamily member 10A-like isoform X4 [Oenanthe melanoleuca]|uniref:tumor necrosis factor receptor superfamily member 10A-like isoform X4 n=1 Tax=Oenanthe melanoleuca TaxID=2939378 RepID=UPI0024C1617A|nr:tumor necrosis factor receptor superfamily member 10A-like isoform X4 [Oenanthe melanoleuca]